MTCNKPAHLKGKKIYQLREDDVCPRTGIFLTFNDLKMITNNT